MFVYDDTNVAYEDLVIEYEGQGGVVLTDNLYIWDPMGTGLDYRALDYLNISDLAQGLLNRLVCNVSDDLRVSDIVSPSLSRLVRLLFDTNRVHDNPIPSMGLFKVLSDNVYNSDNTPTGMELAQWLADNLAMSDSIGAGPELNSSLADSMTIADFMNKHLTKLNASIANSVTISDEDAHDITRNTYWRMESPGVMDYVVDHILVARVTNA